MLVSLCLSGAVIAALDHTIGDLQGRTIVLPQKNPALNRIRAGFFLILIVESGRRVLNPKDPALERADLVVEARLVTRGLVAVDEALADTTVNEGHSRLEGALGRGFVTRLDGRDHFLDGRAHGGTLGCVTLTIALGLTGTFTC
jgi:hypothetical protein